MLAFIAVCLVKLILFASLAWGSRRDKARKARVQVLVLGDLGRSPRMQYHATSLAQQGWLVDLLGYCDSPLPTQITEAKGVRVLRLSRYPQFWETTNKALFPLTAPFKIAFQILSLCKALCVECEPAKCMLVQNPPAIPTLAVALLVCWFRGQHLIIDWHNFGHSLLALRLTPGHWLVLVAEWYERRFGRLANAHLCVTDAMATVLQQEYDISAPIQTVHDRPASIFLPLPRDRRSEILAQLSTHTPLDDSWLLVSSTSWTDDEDFSLLLRALIQYAAEPLPKLQVVITGKGTNRAPFEAQVRELEREGKLTNVRIMTCYFDRIEDYARLLGVADLGISLHTSSSGVDLPMKVVDMFGTGLPVVGWSKFAAWPELVKEGVNGCGFEDSEGLLRALKSLLHPHAKKLDILRRGALQEDRWRWQDEWETAAAPLFQSLKH